MDNSEIRRIEVIFEDENILAVNKPAGLPVLPDGWDPKAPYLLEILSNDHRKLWVVHRLDKLTSGVVLFAINAEAHRFLNIQFEHHRINKVYHAIIEGVPNWISITCDQPLRMNVGHSHKTVVDIKLGKPSSTTFNLLDTNNKFSLIEALPKTGRTHQIRAHLSNIGFPILGDSLYGGHGNKFISRMALHSYSISFEDMNTDQHQTITASYPIEFSRALSLLGLSLEK